VFSRAGPVKMTSKSRVRLRDMVILHSDFYADSAILDFASAVRQE